MDCLDLTDLESHVLTLTVEGFGERVIALTIGEPQRTFSLASYLEAARRRNAVGSVRRLVFLYRLQRAGLLDLTAERAAPVSLPPRAPARTTRTWRQRRLEIGALQAATRHAAARDRVLYQPGKSKGGDEKREGTTHLHDVQAVSVAMPLRS